MNLHPTKPVQGATYTPDLWEEALKALSADDYQTIGANSPNKAEILEKLLTVTKEKKELCLQKRWKFCGKEGDVILRDQLEKVTTWIVKFKDTGNAVAQYDP